MLTPEEKEFIWKEKRRGKITASVLPDLMTKGRGKDELFGQKSLSVLYPIRYERRTGVTRESASNKNFEWGHENEPLAIEWIRSQLINGVKSCSDDFEEIVFNEPFPGFGDSPDFYVYGPDGVTVTAIGEIKCPVGQGKIEELQFLSTISKSTEYYYQFLGHFIGRPDVNTLYYVVYDGYLNDGRIIEMSRSDHIAEIQEVTDRIKLAHDLINDSLELDKDFPELLSEMKSEEKQADPVKAKEKPATNKRSANTNKTKPETIEAIQAEIDSIGTPDFRDTRKINRIRILNNKLKKLTKKQVK